MFSLDSKPLRVESSNRHQGSSVTRRAATNPENLTYLLVIAYSLMTGVDIARVTFIGAAKAILLQSAPTGPGKQATSGGCRGRSQTRPLRRTIHLLRRKSTAHAEHSDLVWPNFRFERLHIESRLTYASSLFASSADLTGTRSSGWVVAKWEVWRCVLRKRTLAPMEVMERAPKGATRSCGLLPIRSARCADLDVRQSRSGHQSEESLHNENIGIHGGIRCARRRRPGSDEPARSENYSPQRPDQRQ